VFRQSIRLAEIIDAVYAMMRIIKLGGSLLSGGDLRACLDIIAYDGGQQIIVPGGGVFADQVRHLQAAYGFDDVAAHRMAILAMHQLAILFNGLQPKFTVCDSLEKLFAASGIRIWSPDITELDAAGIPASWDISSDSLAAWLAQQVPAAELVLVKCADVPINQSYAELAAQGIVDSAFPEFAKGLSCPINIINIKKFLDRI
jgi:5-(aminomethyl)-3-furanmethanol phosphate kinase